MAWHRLDEVNVVGVMTRLVAHEPQPCQGFLDQLTLRRSLACQYTVVHRRVVAHQRAIHDGDPPDRLTDHRERTRPLPCPGPDKASCRLAHRGDRPIERAHPGRPISCILAVPCDSAASRAEPGMLAARQEQSATLLAVPDISHQGHVTRNAHGRDASRGVPKLTVGGFPLPGYTWDESPSADRTAAVMTGRSLRPGSSGHGLQNRQARCGFRTAADCGVLAACDKTAADPAVGQARTVQQDRLRGPASRMGRLQLLGPEAVGDRPA